MRIFLVMLLAAITAGCAVSDTGGSAVMERNAKWVMLPVLNHTEVPQAGLRTEAITEALLRAHGISDLTRYPATLSQDTLLQPAERKVFDEADKWARAHGARYAIFGAVDEWRYKVGIDGEPAVGVALHVRDMQSNAIVWSGVGGRSGWSREALSAVAQKLIRQLLATAPIQ